MPDKTPDADLSAIQNPQLSREDLAPEARSARDTASGLGFGSAYPGPLVDRPDEPRLGDAADAAGEPLRTALPDEPDAPPSPVARYARDDDPYPGVARENSGT
jgi:hypothetical protein